MQSDKIDGVETLDKGNASTFGIVEKIVKTTGGQMLPYGPLVWKALNAPA